MSRLALLLLVAAAARAEDAAPQPKPAPLVTYTFTETVRARTPAGETGSHLVATVSVAGDRARLEAERPLPRTTAAVAIAARDGITLLDRTQKVEASAARADFEGLFTGRPPAEAGSASFAFQDVAARAVRDGAGKPFDGRPTARYRVTLSYTLRSMTPGRVATSKSETSATIETLDGADDARSPFDSLERLFGARGEAREALSSELANVKGFPVSVSLESSAEMSSSTFAVPGGGAPEGGLPQPPLKTTRTATRSVRSLARRPFVERDAALFAAPEDYHARSLESLLVGAPSLP